MNYVSKTFLFFCNPVFSRKWKKRKTLNHANGNYWTCFNLLVFNRFIAYCGRASNDAPKWNPVHSESSYLQHEVHLCVIYSLYKYQSHEDERTDQTVQGESLL